MISRSCKKNNPANVSMKSKRQQKRNCAQNEFIYHSQSECLFDLPAESA